MTNRLLLSLMAAFLCMHLCSAQLPKLFLHPKPVGNEKQSVFTDSLRFYPLQLKENISLGSFSNVQISENYYIITDYPNKNLLLFARNGSFVKEISFKKMGELFPSYRRDLNQIIFFGNNKNYTLTPRDRIKILLDWNNPRNRKYFTKYIIDLNDSTLALKKMIPDKFNLIGAYRYYDDYFRQTSISISDLYKDSTDHEIKLYKGNELIKAFFPYNRVNEPKYLYTQSISVAFSPTDTPYVNYVTRPYCDTIYKLVKDSLFPVYKVVMPLENTPPPSLFTTPFKSKTDRDNYNRNNGWMLRQIMGFYETPGTIMMTVSYMTNFDVYLYNKKNNSFYLTRNIRPDASQYNLPLLSDFTLTRKDGKLYKIIKAGELINFFKQNPNTTVPKDLEPYLRTNPDAAAPVVVEFKLKN